MSDAPDHFEIERVLTWAGFSEFRRVSGRLGVADLFDPERRTGIYVLGFRDGTYYVGKATDVTGRFRDHRDNKDPVDGMAFREVTTSYRSNVRVASGLQFDLKPKLREMIDVQVPPAPGGNPNNITQGGALQSKPEP